MNETAMLNELLKSHGITVALKPIARVPYADMHEAITGDSLAGRNHFEIKLTKDGDEYTGYITGVEDEKILDDDSRFAVIFHIVFDTLCIMHESFDDWMEQVEEKYGPVTNRNQARFLYEFMTEDARLLLDFMGMELFVDLSTLFIPAIAEYMGEIRKD